MGEDNKENMETKETVSEVVTNKRAGNIEAKEETKKGLNKGLIITAIILTAIAISMVVFALVNKLNKKVYSNVYLNGINVSGKTEQEVASIVQQLGKDILTREIDVKNSGAVLQTVSATSLDMQVDETKTLTDVMNFGRKENVVTNNFNIFVALFSKKEIKVTYKYSEDKLTQVANQVSSEIEGRVIDDSYALDEKEHKLTITKGKSGKDIIITEFKAEIVEALKDTTLTAYEAEVSNRQPEALDVDVVYAHVARDAKDAYVDETVKPKKYISHVVGITFDKEQLKELLEKEENQKEGTSFDFALTITEPKVKLADVMKDAYEDLLGTYTSSFSNSDANRASNVVLGASILNGAVLMPGEVFSFNARMGDCGLSSRGFKAAAVFKGDSVAQEIGGGICQLSSTLYNAALYANLDIVARSNHSLPVGYVPAGLDATIYYPGLDFKFQNSREYPIKIVATTTSSRKLTVSIYGTRQDVEYDIELSTVKTASIAPQVIEEPDSTLEVGQQKTIQAGVYGYKSVSYKIKKLDGKVISKVQLSQDTYRSMPKKIAVGTKQVETTPAVDPTPVTPQTPIATSQTTPIATN